MAALTRLYLTIFFTLSALTGLCQRSSYDPAHLYPVRELQEDLKFVRLTLESTHPDLYLYTPKETFDSFFDSLSRSIVKPLSAADFYNLLTLINATIKDGHTMLLPVSETLEYYNRKCRFLPFYVAVLGNRLYVSMNCSADTLIKEGVEITSINGVAAKAILQYLSGRQIRDGYNQTYPVWILTSYFKEYYGFSYGHPDIFSVTYRSGKADTAIATIAALSKDSIKWYRESKYPKRNVADNKKKGIDLQMDKRSRTAILSIKSFDTAVLQELYKQDFDSTIKSMFTRIHHASIRNLIVDIRNNQGGDFEPGKRLLSYLLLRPLTYLPYSEEEKKIIPDKNGFKGNLYLLINGGSFSATAIVSSYLQLAKRGVFIGEETGGNKTRISGNPVDTTLPHTGITLMVSTVKYTIRNGYNDGRGVMPDYHITYTMDDIIANKDLEMELALRMILKKRKD